METVYLTLLMISGVMIIGLVGYVLYLLFRRKAFTRERFAFVAMGGNLALLTTVLFPILAGQNAAWSVLANFISSLFEMQNAAPTTSFSEKVLTLVAYFIFISFLSNLYKNWSGPKSVRQQELEASKISTTLTQDALWEAKRLFQNRPLELAGDTRRSFADISFSKATPWKDRIRELIQLRRSNLKFDADSGWREELRLWVGDNNDTGAKVGIWCVSELKNILDVEPILIHLRKTANNSEVELIVTGMDEVPAGACVDRVNIECFTENDLLDDLVNFEEYYRSIESRFRDVKLSDSNLSLQNVYVPSAISNSVGATISENLTDFLMDWVEEPGERQFALFGGYGQGKSTGTLNFAYESVQKIRSGYKGRIPILIELRGKAPSTMNVQELLATWAMLYGINPRSLYFLMEAGRLTLIFDGFDEMAEAGTADQRVAHFNSLWKLYFSGAKILFAGRDHFLRDEVERKAALGEENSHIAGPYAEIIRLQLFDVPRIETSLRSFDDLTRNEIVEAIKQGDSNLLDIIARPSLSFVVGSLWPQLKKKQRLEGITTGAILRLFVKHSYRRQSEKLRNAPGHFMVLSENEREYFMLGVAAYMAVHKYPNQIDLSEFEKIVEHLLENIPEIAPVTSVGASLPSMDMLKVRLEGRASAKEEIATDVRTYGILETDPSRAGALRFAHKSFFELLVAECMRLALVDASTTLHKAIAQSTGFSILDGQLLPVAMSLSADIVVDELSDEEIGDFRALYRKLKAGSWLVNKILSMYENRMHHINKLIHKDNKTRNSLSYIIIHLLVLALYMYPFVLVRTLYMMPTSQFGVRRDIFVLSCLSSGFSEEVMIEIVGIRSLRRAVWRYRREFMEDHIGEEKGQVGILNELVKMLT